MIAITVTRSITEITGAELLEAYDNALTEHRKDLRAEILRRLQPHPQSIQGWQAQPINTNR